jgi:hypothetical protein
LPGITVRQKKNIYPAAILMPCVKPSGRGFSGIGYIAHTLGFTSGALQMKPNPMEKEQEHHWKYREIIIHGDGEDRMCSIMATTFYFLMRS